MKTLLALAGLFLAASFSPALLAQRLTAESFAQVKTYNVSELGKLDRIPANRLIGIRFNYRHERIRKLKPNWYQASLWQYAPGEKKKFAYVQVMVPQKALEQFKTLPTKFDTGTEHVAYGEIRRDAEATKWRFIRLFGTKADRDAAGNVTLGW